MYGLALIPGMPSGRWSVVAARVWSVADLAPDALAQAIVDQQGDLRVDGKHLRPRTQRLLLVVDRHGQDAGVGGRGGLRIHVHQRLRRDYAFNLRARRAGQRHRASKDHGSSEKSLHNIRLDAGAARSLPAATDSGRTPAPSL
jgi:hypothetical protein